MFLYIAWYSNKILNLLENFVKSRFFKFMYKKIHRENKRRNSTYLTLEKYGHLGNANRSLFIKNRFLSMTNNNVDHGVLLSRSP